jgi:7-cyano-7-deazaguanine synthase
MCGIAGFIRVHGSTGRVSRQFELYFNAVLTAISQRGPDSFGIGIFGDSTPSNPFISKRARAPLAISDQVNIICNAYQSGYVLAGFRGVPTTEAWNPDDPKCVQPYINEESGSGVTHNGMVANDKELAALYGLGPPLIDSYILLTHLAEADGMLKERLSELESGSAIAMYDEQHDNLILARNFRGLALAVWQNDEQTFLVWASEESALQHHAQRDVLIVTAELPGWHFYVGRPEDAWINGNSPSYYLDALIASCQGWGKPASASKCVVVCSGGLDSMTVAALACKRFSEVHLLHYTYGARAELPEGRAVKDICKWLNEHTSAEVRLKFIDLSFIKDLGGSTLTEHDKDIALGDLGVETAHEWVPARNTAMIGLAASYCDRYDIGYIALGLNMEEASVYADNSQEFYLRMEQALQFGTMARPKLWMPLGNMMKHHVYAMALELEAPLHLSWSCYLGLAERCGQCGPCVMRQRAAEMNGVADNVEYATPLKASAIRLVSPVSPA